MPFRSEFARSIFNQKYRHEGAETWGELADTLVAQVCKKYMNLGDMTQLAQYIADMKFIPGGRYLYYAGRKKRFFNNCFAGETRLYTDKGLRRFDSFADGESVNVLSPITGTFLPATMHTHGVQTLRTITFENVRGRSRKQWQVRATRTHHWPLVGGGDTYDLRVGDVVPANSIGHTYDECAWLHGLVYADGSYAGENAAGTGHRYQLRLCGEKAKHVARITAITGVEPTYPDFANGDPCFYLKSERNWKELPVDDDGAAYITGFLTGWFELDGHRGECQKIHSIDVRAIEFMVRWAPLIGKVASGEVNVDTRPNNYGERKPLYHVNLIDGARFAGFKVVSIEDGESETVWCPFEPEHNRIVLEYGIDTYQCFLLKSEDDTREDWANLSWKAESALMSGGGIGNDYSVYRAEGTQLGSTGGTASGPIPKMKMINEIGRNVMQGGSRRSAIYASLSADHPDVMKFIHSKDWNDMVVAGTSGLSVGDLKRADYNYAAPLDMTNISVNYSDEWLAKPDRANDPVFKANVKQALKTAEPGLSFNFGDKSNETLRNACCEVTSEDDSDVCNLGSLNLSRIESVDELRDVIRLAVMFLICGTLEAQLPYEKVYRVREKNRRLGLGLMGVHEWLIQRGHRYEVVPELHEWLAVYRDESARVSMQFADALGISRPVANRAIAPTGTIGIMAGTTTGIEPLFAVAYKRRYLKNGTDWHYQYEIDGTARAMIERYGADPERIESAIDLAADPERRIAFQADVQDYVDMAISSTINLPEWGSELNNEDTVDRFAQCLSEYAPRLRGFTCYPDGARGGQPLTSVPYGDAVHMQGQEFSETFTDVCDLRGGGVCGV